MKAKINELTKTVKDQQSEIKVLEKCIKERNDETEKIQWERSNQFGKC